MYRYRLMGACVLALLLTACAAFMVPETSDPAKKLGWARELIENQNRPIPAERLIVEAVGIYQQQQNELGLAEAYRMYGLFFKSRAVGNFEEYYQKNGFNDKTASYGARYQKAIEYFDKARVLLEKNDDVRWITNVHVQKAFAYELMNNIGAACDAYDAALKSHHAAQRSHPDLVTLGFKGLSNFEQEMVERKKRLGCPT
jgi:tetratricopeptide (TPR) repeat protein